MDLEILAMEAQPQIKEPPVVLVKTWVMLINSKEDKQVREHATNMLISTFGDLATALAFCRKHNISIR